MAEPHQVPPGEAFIPESSTELTTISDFSDNVEDCTEDEYNVAHSLLTDFLDQFIPGPLTTSEVYGRSIVEWFINPSGNPYHRLPELIRDCMLAAAILVTGSGHSTTASRLLIGQLAWVRCQTPQQTIWSDIRRSIHYQEQPPDGDELLSWWELEEARDFMSRQGCAYDEQSMEMTCGISLPPPRTDVAAVQALLDGSDRSERRDDTPLPSPDADAEVDIDGDGDATTLGSGSSNTKLPIPSATLSDQGSNADQGEDMTQDEAVDTMRSPPRARKRRNRRTGLHEFPDRAIANEKALPIQASHKDTAMSPEPQPARRQVENMKNGRRDKAPKGQTSRSAASRTAKLTIGGKHPRRRVVTTKSGNTLVVKENTFRSRRDERHKYDSGRAVARKNNGLLLPKAPFDRLVSEIVQDITPGTRISARALEVLLARTDAFLALLFESANLAAIHAGRITVMGRDMTLVRRLGGYFTEPEASWTI